jgi:4-carboxymuconolactone decarboxylase
MSKRGKAQTARATIWGDKAEKIEANLKALDPELAELILNVAYDNVFERPGLDLKTKELLAIAHLLNVGSESELKTHIHGALNCGASEAEIKEVFLHAAMFIGFPKSVAGMKILKAVLVTR